MKFLQANGLPHPYVMLLLAPLFWATSNVTGKLGKAWLSPYEFTFWRWLLATALLSLLFRARIRHDGPELHARAGWLLVVGGSGFALFNIVLYSAFARGASVVNVSIITALIPLAVLLVDVLVLRGRAHPLQWCGVALSFVGVVWVVSRGHPAALLEQGIAPGDRLALVSSAIYAGYSLALRRAPRVHWASLLWAMCLAATVVSLPFFVAERLREGWRLPPWQAWAVARLCGAVCLDCVEAVLYGRGDCDWCEPRGADDEPVAGVRRADRRRLFCRRAFGRLCANRAVAGRSGNWPLGTGRATTGVPGLKGRRVSSAPLREAHHVAIRQRIRSVKRLCVVHLTEDIAPAGVGEIEQRQVAAQAEIGAVVADGFDDFLAEQFRIGAT